MPDRYGSTKERKGFKLGLLKTSDLITHSEKDWKSTWTVPAPSVVKKSKLT